MYRTHKNSFETKIINTEEFNSYKNIKINFNTKPEHVFNYNTESTLSTPDRQFKLLYNGGQIILKGTKYTFNDTTIVWIEDSNLSIENHIPTITKPIFIGPTRLKFNKSIELIIKISDRESLDYSSIYKYNTHDNEWEYIPSSIDHKELSLIADIDSGGIYAVIQEQIPPIITNIYPGNDGSYYQNDFREIKFKLNDDQSGIKDETSIKLQIDDAKPLIFEYNIYRNEVIYKLDQKISKGDHTIKIDVVDNVGNRTYRENQFHIKE